MGTMPTYRDLFPEQGAVGEKYVIEVLRNLYLRDCLVILSQLSKHYYKYCQMQCGGEKSLDIYKVRCLELLDPEIQLAMARKNPPPPKNYAIIFPELSIIHLIKMCLCYCNDENYTKDGNEFSKETLHSIGKCLLIMNSVFADWQLKNVPTIESLSEELLANFTKQLIVDKNFNVYQKMYQNYFIFKNFLINFNGKFDIDVVFIEKYGVKVLEYFAFLSAMQGQFMIKNELKEDWDLPFLDFDSALKNLKPKFRQKLLNNFLINDINYKKIDRSFFNLIDIIKRPLIKLPDNKVIPLSLRRLFSRLTDAVYFDIFDYLDEEEKERFSAIFGEAVEEYFRDIVFNIDKNFIPSFSYGKDNNQTPDAILVQNQDLIFFECKKRQFHTLEFLKNGDGKQFFGRLNEFCFIPLNQICNRIKDFRERRYTINSVNNEGAIIYPVVVFPSLPPLFSGAWDKFNFNKYVLPNYYQQDKRIGFPEFIDFSELESIEEYLRENSQLSFFDLINMKRNDVEHHNSNWAIFLYKNNMIRKNKRLLERYLGEVEKFKELLFEVV